MQRPCAITSANRSTVLRGTSGRCPVWKSAVGKSLLPTRCGILATPQGITDYAQGELGDIVYVELPSVGAKFGKHDVFGTIEAVKAVSELFCPAQGEVVEVNGRLDQEPALVNTSPYEDGWMVKLRLSNPGDRSGLLSADQYRQHVGG